MFDKVSEDPFGRELLNFIRVAITSSPFVWVAFGGFSRHHDGYEQFKTVT